MRRKRVLPVVAAFSVLVAACAVPLLTPQQSGQYCAVEVHGPSGAPVLAQSALLDPAADAATDVLAGASRVGLAALVVVLHPFGQLLMLGGDPGKAIYGAQACDPDKLPRPTAFHEFRSVVDSTDAEVLARALKAALDAPRAACTPSHARRDPEAVPDGRLEIEVVAVIAGCLVGQVQYRVDARWALKNAQTGGKVVATVTQCVLESRRSVEDWLDHPTEARTELEGALAATGQRVAAELIVGYPPAAQCRLHSNADWAVSPH
jgi:hypothetical protein